VSVITYPYQPLTIRINIKQWIIRFFGGFLLWVCFIALGLVALKGNMQGFATKQWWHETGVVYLLYGFLNFLIFFGILHFIIPSGLKKKQYLLMVLHTYILITLMGVVKYYICCLPRFDYVRISYYKNGNEQMPVYFTFGQYLMKTIFTGTFISILAYGWGLTTNWFRGEKERKELENKRLAAELSFLRMQINPHFLFNSLNSIYSLSLKKSDDTPEAVLQLSELMRYMLYEREDDQHKVALEKEIDYLQNYIGLQHIRFRNQLHVDFRMEGDITGKKIVPLLLVPFVENGFKHGVLSDTSSPLQIHLIIEGERLLFSVKNKKSIENKDHVGGVGLENVKKRLAILYPGKYQLTISNDNEFYQSDLILLL